jgi:hypothetical protein
MKGTATTGAGATRDVDRYVLARQGIRKWMASWCSFRAIIISARRQRSLHPGNLDSQVFKPERELILIQPL